MSGMLKDVVDSIFSPTTKPQAGVVKAMNYSFYALFATLAGLAYATGWNNHVLALSGVAVLLFASISWFIAELGKIEDTSKKSDGSTSSTSSSSSNNNAKRATSAPSQAPGTESYAEVAAEPLSSSTSAIVNDRSGLTERKTRSQAAAQQSSASTNGGANGNGNDGASYAQVAAEEPDSTNNAIKDSKVGVVEAAGMSYINKPASASASATSQNDGQGAESYAQAAAEEPDAQESVVREDRVGHTETK